MSDKQLVRGTMVLTASIFISKFLGLIYIFPFQAIVGLEGLALYTFGYTPYTVILSLATMGVPLAVSKYVSKYNALGDYRTGQRLFKSGIVIMSITGIIAFLALFFLAEPIAKHILDPSTLEGNSIEDAVFTIRMVSVALLVVPVMAIIRGYFQGFQSMGPTAISQVIEQIVRVAFILISTYLIVNVWNGSIGTAVGFATFAAFVGALGGLAVLIIYWMKRRGSLQRKVETSTIDHQIPLPEMYKELISYALPISFVGLAIPLYQLVDLMTFNNAMTTIGYTQAESMKYFGALTQAAHKLILIPVSVATAMSLTILPTVTNSYINQEFNKVQQQVTQTFQIIFFVAIPASVGLFILSDSAYVTLFGIEDIAIGADVLKHYAPTAILFSVFAVSASLLQGINRQRYTVIALLIGVTFKAIFNHQFIVWFDYNGSILATITGYVLAIFINVWAISKHAHYNFNFLLKRLILILMFAGTMGIGVFAVRSVLENFFPLETRVQSIFVLAISIVVGIAIYFYLSLRSGLAEKILGERFQLRKKRR